MNIKDIFEQVKQSNNDIEKAALLLEQAIKAPVNSKLNDVLYASASWSPAKRTRS